jgi:hypothetical protein
VRCSGGAARFPKLKMNIEQGIRAKEQVRGRRAVDEEAGD